jgi:hypothetical protein
MLRMSALFLVLGAGVAAAQDSSTLNRLRLAQGPTPFGLCQNQCTIQFDECININCGGKQAPQASETIACANTCQPGLRGCSLACERNHRH